MKKTILILLILCSSSFGQRTQRLLNPADQGNGFLYTQMAASDTATWQFIFSQNKDRNQYSGFAATVVWTDTASGGAGARDSLFVYSRPLFYDPVSNAYESGADNTDSTVVANWLNWGTNHADTKYSAALATNFMACDGIEVVAITVGAAVAIRPQIRIGYQEP